MAKEPEKDIVESLFFEALSLPIDQRSAFLDGACRGNPARRAQVEELLAAEATKNSLFDRPPVMDVSTTANIVEHEGQLIGNYKLLQQIGEGGFGVVYMAEQMRPVHRKVALKIIKPGMDSKEVVARFEAERQALAIMDHPNIAKVLDAGVTDSGRPYFAMELVKGVTITHYCDENHLDTRARMQLFMQVCRAVQHAHQKGIIHRDIKPTNVMVTLHDGKPVPKVIDFGVAKALNQSLTEKTLFTRYGQIVGTPQYMSPEQAEMSGLDVDTRSDIYSLGVMLYELLTGQTPLDAESLRSAGYDAMRQMIRDAEPQKPSTRVRTLDRASATCVATQRATQIDTLSRSLSGDLDWIVMKTLEKDRNRRYESAVGLIGDVERYLRDEPVEAGPPTLLYQLTKLFRRHRAAVTTAATIAALLIVTVFVTTFAWYRADQQRVAAEWQREKAERLQRDLQQKSTELEEQASAARREASRATQSLEVIKRLFVKAAPDPKYGENVKVRDFLTGFARELDREPLGDKEVEVDVRLTLATSFAAFGMYSDAEEQAGFARDAGSRLWGSDSDRWPSFLIRLARAYGQSRSGEEILRELNRMPVSDVEKVQVLNMLARCVRLSTDECLLHLRKACQTVDTLSDTEKRQFDDNPYSFLSDRLLDCNEWEEAWTANEKAMRLATLRSDDEDLIRSLIQRSKLHLFAGETVKAKDSGKQALNAIYEHKRFELLENCLNSILSAELQSKDRSHLRETALSCREMLLEKWDLAYGDGNWLATGRVVGTLFATGCESEGNELLEYVDRLPAARVPFEYQGAGQLLKETGHLCLADGFFQKAILHPFRKTNQAGNIWPLVGRYRCRMAVRDWEGALELFSEASEILNVTGQSEELWSRLWIESEMAEALAAAGQSDAAARKYADVGSVLSKDSGNLWGNVTHALTLLCMLKSGSAFSVDNDSVTKYVQMINSRPYIGWPTGKSLAHASVGLLNERNGDMPGAIAEFQLAAQSRKGIAEQINCEWITNHLVDLMTQAGRLDELEAILREDITRRDGQVFDIHPERAFVRLRLVQFLLDHSRSLDGVEPLLDEAAKVYEFQGDFLPQKEHDTLAELRQRVTAAKAQSKE
ncbi:MAG: serine/threonine-protein kinase [Pirellulaceae bacterium]